MSVHETGAAPRAEPARKRGPGAKRRAKTAPAAARGRRPGRAGQASQVAFHLDPELRALCAAGAAESGLELGHFLQRIVRRWALEHAAPEAEVAARLAAKDEVIDRTVALARRLDAEGRFDAHFILTVLREAMADDDFRQLYETVTGAPATDSGVAAKTPLNQQLGRVIKSAVGARSSIGPDGKRRAQVTGEAIQSYSLLEKPSEA
jgi:hypothetical protein